MARYKVIQDIEADDKLLGPLSLRQFIYALVAVGFLYLSYFALTKGAAFLLVIFLPPIFLAAFFAFPWSKEQPTELWALARIRFLLKPRKRIWDQSGMKELVTITAPKKIERIYTDGLSQTEVKSRLQALASTIDSRGWAIKSANMSPYTASPVFVGVGGQTDDRLVGLDSLPMATPLEDTTVYDDVLDPDNNPKAQQFDSMLEQNAQMQRDRLMATMQQSPAPVDTPQANTTYPSSYTSNQPMQQPSDPVQPPSYGFPGGSLSPVSRNDEQAIVDELRDHADSQQLQYSHMPTILPISEQQKMAQAASAAPISSPFTDPPALDDPIAAQASSQSVTPEPDAAILELAQKDDWNISTIARQAKKAHGEEPEEVVISLH